MAVLGLGRSGLSAAQSLMNAGATVFAWDDQEKNRQAAVDRNIPLTDLYTCPWDLIETLVLSPGIPHHYPTPHPLAKRAQEKGIPCISDLEIFRLSQPQAQVVAVTGTNGKSTTTALIAHSLKVLGIPSEMGGNIGIPVLTLNPLEEKGIYVLELSSYQLEITPHLAPTIGVLLNITPDHLERHGGMEGYIKAKTLIFKNAARGLIGVDDPICQNLYKSSSSSSLGGTELTPVAVTQFLSKGICVHDGILYENGQKIADVTLFDRLKGSHNWQNMAAAYGVLRLLGLPREEIIKAIGSFPGLAHRQQHVLCHRNVLFINDSKATNGEAVDKAFKSYPGRPIYWLLGGQPKEGGIESLAPHFPQVAHAFLFGMAAPQFELSLQGKVDYTVCETLEEATHKAADLAFSRIKEDAIVLLSPACASWDQFRDFEERGEAFCRYVHAVVQRVD